MKKLLKLVILIICLNINSCSCNKDKTSFTMGVWWWNETLDDSYLEFADDNGINEIYYSSDLSSDTSKFIKKANSKGIDVYWLIGNYTWLDDRNKLDNKINSYIDFQSNSKYRFKGIHLDVEPHQSEKWDSEENELVYKLVDMAFYLDNAYKNIDFDYDIPFWLDHMIKRDNVTKEAYKWMIDVASRVFIMSYRDSSDAIYSISEDEIEYAKDVNKKVILGVETYSEEGNFVSFYEEGKEYMYNEIEELKEKIPSNYGVSIHHIKTWYDLKD